MGIKPLYLRRHRFGVAVASEIPALLPVFGPPKIRPEAVSQFLLLGRVVDGGTLFDGIEQVQPGERLLLKEGRAAQLGAEAGAPVAGSNPVDSEELRAMIRAAVQQTLVSDRSIGLALSGGLDSTIIALELAELGVEEIATVSVLPHGNGDGVASIEELVLPGNAWRTWRHVSIPFGAFDLLDGIPHAVAALGEPTTMTSIPMYAVLAAQARESGIVVLMLGEGADELFGGYRSYLSLPGLGTASDFYLSPSRGHLVAGLIGADRKQAAEDALRSALPVGAGREPATVVREFEYRHSLEPLLRRADHLLMAQGIEGRTPFLHGGLPRAAATLPDHARIRDAQTKMALREAYAERLPRFLNEVKKPFRAPLAAWTTGASYARVQAMLAGHVDRLAEIGVDPRGAAEVIRRVRSGDSDSASTVFALLTLGAWLQWLEA